MGRSDFAPPTSTSWLRHCNHYFYLFFVWIFDGLALNAKCFMPTSQNDRRNNIIACAEIPERRRNNEFRRRQFVSGVGCD